jgi:hypothetical protein
VNAVAQTGPTLRLVARKLDATSKRDELTFERGDGSRSTIDMPRQGILPHDLLHFVVEDGLALDDGFLSLIAAGADARFTMEALHDPAGCAVADAAVRAEALVEALQAQLWSGAFDAESFTYGVEMACASRGVGPGELPARERARALFDRARSLFDAWANVPPGETLRLAFGPTR